MNVATITMPKEQAIQAYREYREAVRSNPNPEDRAVMMGYKALAKGNAVIDLCDVMGAAGLDELGRPKLAVARAHWPFAHLRANGQIVRFQETANGGARGWKWRVEIPRDT